MLMNRKPLLLYCLAAGGRHSLALTVDGKVFSWGEGDDGKLGHASRMWDLNTYTFISIVFNTSPIEFIETIAFEKNHFYSLYV